MIPEELTQFIKNFDCLLLPETCMRNEWMSALAGQAASILFQMELINYQSVTSTTPEAVQTFSSENIINYKLICFLRKGL